MIISLEWSNGAGSSQIRQPASSIGRNGTRRAQSSTVWLESSGTTMSTRGRASPPARAPWSARRAAGSRASPCGSSGARRRWRAAIANSICSRSSSGPEVITRATASPRGCSSGNQASSSSFSPVSNSQSSANASMSCSTTGPSSAEMRVAHRMRRDCRQHVLVADVDAAGEGETAVDHQQLAMVAQVEERRLPRHIGMQEPVDRHAGVAAARCRCPSGNSRRRCRRSAPAPRTPRRWARISASMKGRPASSSRKM